MPDFAVPSRKHCRVYARLAITLPLLFWGAVFAIHYLPVLKGWTRTGDCGMLKRLAGYGEKVHKYKALKSGFLCTFS